MNHLLAALTGYDLEALPDSYAALPRLEKPVALDLLIRSAEGLFVPA